MLNKIDWFFVVLLGFGVLGHSYGTFALSEPGSGIFVWSLSGVLASALVVALNVLRKLRAEDRAIAWVSLAGSLGWLVIAILFGRSIGNSLDPRSLVHAIAAIGLAFFSMRAVVN